MMKDEELDLIDDYAKTVVRSHSALCRVETYLEGTGRAEDAEPLLRRILRQLPRLCDMAVGLVGEVRRLRHVQIEKKLDCWGGLPRITCHAQEVVRLLNEASEKGRIHAAAPAIAHRDSVSMLLHDGMVLHLTVDLLPGNN